MRPQRAANRARVSVEIARILVGGGTDVLSGLEEAGAILETVETGRKHVILVSDGEAPSEGIAELVEQMRKDKVTISTVALESADLTLLRQISHDGAGRLYDVKDLGMLSPIIVEETERALK